MKRRQMQFRQARASYLGQDCRCAPRCLFPQPVKRWGCFEAQDTERKVIEEGGSRGRNACQSRSPIAYYALYSNVSKGGREDRCCPVSMVLDCQPCCCSQSSSDHISSLQPSPSASGGGVIVDAGTDCSFVWSLRLGSRQIRPKKASRVQVLEAAGFVDVELGERCGPGDVMGPVLLGLRLS